MKYRPILFNTPMAQAILEDRKTQTRRLPWLQPGPEIELRIKKTEDGKIVAHFYRENPLYDEANKSPYGAYQEPMCQVGDVLWVRETWNVNNFRENEETGASEVGFIYLASNDPDNGFQWNAVSADSYVKYMDSVSEYFDKWRPSIHMPKEAARIFLKVTGIRIERLQEITHEDVIAEGVKGELLEAGNADNPYKSSECIRYYFDRLWDSTIKKQHVIYYGWEANPWVWVYEFERIEKPEGWPNV